MTAAVSTITSSNETHLIDVLVNREKSILRLKAEGWKCLQIQKELGIDHKDKSAVKHLRQIYFGEQIGSLPDWTIDKDYRPLKNSPENVMHMIKAMGQKVRLNLQSNEVYINGNPLSDTLLSLIKNEAKRWGLNSTQDHIDDVVKELALSDEYHPFKEWVETSPWDGHDYFKDLFNTLTINPEFEQYTSIYCTDIRYWLIGIIAKQYRHAKNDIVPVLQSRNQGVGKDSWYQKLIPIDGCYAEGEIETSNKDHKFKHADVVIYNVSEIDSTIRKKDSSALKQFLTLKSQKERRPYARYAEFFKSGCSFCGSVNELQFLVDPTGSRRFRIIPVIKVNYQHNINMQQVFAQALHYLNAGEKYWYDENEIDTINEANAAFQIEDKIDIIASKIESGDTAMTCTEILEAYGVKNNHRGQAIALGIRLSKKGIKNQIIKRNGVALNYHYIKEPQEQRMEEIERKAADKRNSKEANKR